MKEKNCSTCDRILPIESFTINRAMPTGYNYDCRDCRSTKRRAEYAQNRDKHRAKANKHRSENREHYRKLCNDWRKNNVEYLKAKKIEREYNLSPERREKIFVVQGHRCPGCGTDDPVLGQWTIDHDHSCCPETCKSCGECIRGLLCHTCNRALGLLKDNKNTLLNLLCYLENPPAKQVLNVRS